MNEVVSKKDFIGLVAEIAAAYVSHNTISGQDLPVLLTEIHGALTQIASGTTASPASPIELKPAVSLKKSLGTDYLICLEDGKKFKSLKRHLRTHYNLSPEEYREKWGLGSDYPMVAPAYAKARSQLAKQLGLGQQRRRKAR